MRDRDDLDVLDVTSLLRDFVRALDRERHETIVRALRNLANEIESEEQREQKSA